MTIIRERIGTVPAATTKLPRWGDVFPSLIDPYKLLIADDMKGADVTLNGSAPSWDKTESAVTWVSQGHTRKADGTARTSSSGRVTAVINVGVADMRVIAKIENATLSGDNPALIFRYVDDSNYWYLSLDVANSITRLTKRVAGTTTNLANGSAIVAGADYEVRCNGDSIKAYANGLLIAEGTDSALNTATRAGFHELNGSSPVRFSNFRAGSL